MLATADDPSSFTWAERALLIAAFALYVVFNCGILTAVNVGLKPRDAEIVLLVGCALPLLLGRGRYCMAATLALALVVVRLAEALFLQRFPLTAVGSHIASVINIAAPFPVSVLMFFVLSRRVWRPVVIWGAAGLIVISAGSNLYEWLGYAKWSTMVGRTAGFHLHPNTGPVYCLLSLGMLYTVNPRFWWNIALTALAAIPTILSLSRSCIVIYGLLAILYVLANFRAHARSVIAVAIAAPLALMLWVSLVESAATHGRLRKDEFIEGRFDAIFRGDVSGLKSSERGTDLEIGWLALIDSPTWGYGTGCAAGERWHPHNQIVATGLELGLLGIVAYVGLLAAPLLWFAMGWWRGSVPLSAIWCQLPLWLLIPCLDWLLEMPPYLLAWMVAWQTVVKHRVEFVWEAAPTHAFAAA